MLKNHYALHISMISFKLFFFFESEPMFYFSLILICLLFIGQVFYCKSTWELFGGATGSFERWELESCEGIYTIN